MIVSNKRLRVDASQTCYKFAKHAKWRMADGESPKSISLQAADVKRKKLEAKATRAKRA